MRIAYWSYISYFIWSFFVEMRCSTVEFKEVQISSDHSLAQCEIGVKSFVDVKRLKV